MQVCVEKKYLLVDSLVHGTFCVIPNDILELVLFLQIRFVKTYLEIAFQI